MPLIRQNLSINSTANSYSVTLASTKAVDVAVIEQGNIFGIATHENASVGYSTHDPMRLPEFLLCIETCRNIY